MLFANVCAPVPVMGNSGNGIFWAFWLLFCVLCAWGVLVLLASFFAHKTWVTLVCLLLGTSFWRCSAGALPL